MDLNGSGGVVASMKALNCQSSSYSVFRTLRLYCMLPKSLHASRDNSKQAVSKRFC
jgi:hypothetical protein